MTFYSFESCYKSVIALGLRNSFSKRLSRIDNSQKNKKMCSKKMNALLHLSNERNVKGIIKVPKLKKVTWRYDVDWNG